MMRTPLASLVLLAALTSRAAAQAPPAIAVDAPPREPGRTEIDIGGLLGGGDIGEQRRFERGVQLNVGRRFGDLVLLGEYDYLTVGDDSVATMSRFGALARYSLLRSSAVPGERSPVSGDFWVEAGAGMERIAWDVGGRLSRPDLALGFGWQVNAVIGKNQPRPRYYGPYVAFRALLARAPAPESEQPATCGGPCDQETRPSRNNVAMFFDFGINWGR
ncbi:MAG TPA: hypothetical protein VL172_17285 [Kofleriaceae bacterium]|nr:hypothetical protein [Kofleriaceae bacterium]